jgi:tRNA-uridine 2-sulfurtransferase
MRGSKAKVVVAMSGGVDSSVAAALLLERGYDVTGVTMKLIDLPPEFCRSETLRNCCGRRATEDAHRVAAVLGIPHYVADMRAPFEKLVIDDFCGEYRRGRTPNPCVRCNRFIKFGLLLENAMNFGADLIATGHYARIERDARTGSFFLKKGRDAAKDQSYFLFGLNQKELSRTLMPLGGLSKREVRRLAGVWKLPVADKPESQEICFIPDNDYLRYLKGRAPDAVVPGPIVDLDGRPLGRHAGIVGFTIGQRRGLGIAAARPLYVIGIEAATHTVIVGPDEALRARRLLVADVSIISGACFDAPFRTRVKIRSRHVEEKAVVSPGGGSKVIVDFDLPQRAISPGQAAVFYRRNTVVGGGTIESVLG